MLKEMKREHRITYLTLDDETAERETYDRSEEYCHELICVPHRQREKFTIGFYGELLTNLVSQYPYAIKKYESELMRREIDKEVKKHRFDVVVCDFLAPAVNLDRDLPCPSILFQHNVEAMIWKRHFEVQSSPLKKAFLWDQWRKMKQFEGKMCRVFDSVIAVSNEDRDQIRDEYGVDAVFDIPTGVDIEFFRPSGREKADPYNLVFTGSMDWLPNEDGIRYFIAEILPIIKRSVPNVSLTVVGRNPYPGLVELSKRDPSVKVTGRVEDVRPFMERAAAYIVPLRIGGGTRLKIFEAMAMEKAIVSTSVGSEGLPVSDGDELILADSPESFADAVVGLLTDTTAATELGRKAARTVRERFGWAEVANRFADICDLTVDATKSKRGVPSGNPVAV